MAYQFINPDTGGTKYTVAPFLDEVVPEDDLVWLVCDAVDSFDLSSIEENYWIGPRGRSAFAPKLLVKVIFYSFINGINSCRQMERCCRFDDRWKVIVGHQPPDHTTVSKFIAANEEQVEDIFIQILMQCGMDGMLRMGVFALDGTKVNGNAALEKNRTEERLREEVKGLVEGVTAGDPLEAAIRASKPSKALNTRKKRIARFQSMYEKMSAEREELEAAQKSKVEAREEREKEAGKPLPGRRPAAPENMKVKEAKINVTDPDSAIMKTRRGYVQGYNGQIMVACTKDHGQLIVAGDFTSKANDVEQMATMLDAAKSNVEAVFGEGTELGAVVADAGYWSESNAALGTEGCELFIATKSGRKMREERNGKPPPRGRIPNGLTAAEKMERRMATVRGQEISRMRGKNVEPVFGQMKTIQGAWQLRRRGYRRCRAEWFWHLCAHNLRKLCQARSRASPGRRGASP